MTPMSHGTQHTHAPTETHNTHRHRSHLFDGGEDLLCAAQLARRGAAQLNVIFAHRRPANARRQEQHHHQNDRGRKEMRMQGERKENETRRDLVRKSRAARKTTPATQTHTRQARHPHSLTHTRTRRTCCTWNRRWRPHTRESGAYPTSQRCGSWRTRGASSRFAPVQMRYAIQKG